MNKSVTTCEFKCDPYPALVVPRCITGHCFSLTNQHNPILQQLQFYKVLMLLLVTWYIFLIHFLANAIQYPRTHRTPVHFLHKFIRILNLTACSRDRVTISPKRRGPNKQANNPSSRSRGNHRTKKRWSVGRAYTVPWCSAVRSSAAWGRSCPPRSRRW